MAAFFRGNSRAGAISDDIILNILGDGNDSDIEDLLDENFLEELQEIDEDPEEQPSLQPSIISVPSTSTQPVSTSTQPVRTPIEPVRTTQPNRRGQTRGRIWRQTSYADKPHDFPIFQVRSPRSPMDYFNEYFDAQFYKLGAECTNNYHMRKTGNILHATPDEIKKLFGLHLLMGIFKFPRLYLYWRQSSRLPVIADIMTRDRFSTLRTSLHFVPEDEPTTDEERGNPLWKVQPVIKKVKEACNKIERVSGNYSIDEQMIPFTGRCSLRQVVRNKPRPVGLKNFVICTSEGLMIDFDIYLGARTAFAERELGVGASVILHLAKAVPPGSCLYFDRFFSSLPLIERLQQLNLHGTGTIMLNRITERRSLNFKADNKMQRGESQQFTCDDLALIKWKDNKSVLMISNCTGADETLPIKRWDKVGKSYVDVPCPKIISNYNKNMGGVDVLDQQMEYYRAFIKTKKWTLKVIIHFVDLAVVNAWRQYRNDCITSNTNKILDLLHFRLEIAEGLTHTPIQGSSASDTDEDVDVSLPPNKKFKQPVPTATKRYDGYGHLPLFDHNLSSPRVCQLETCSCRSKIKCMKCKVYLCLSRGKDCYSLYHQK